MYRTVLLHKRLFNPMLQGAGWWAGSESYSQNKVCETLCFPGVKVFSNALHLDMILPLSHSSFLLIVTLLTIFYFLNALPFTDSFS